MDCSLKGDYSYDDFKIGIYSLFSPVLWIFLSVNFILIQKNTFPSLQLLFTPLVSPNFSHWVSGKFFHWVLVASFLTEH
jgi:hypothetical protein